MFIVAGFHWNAYCMRLLNSKKCIIMTIDELYLLKNVIANEDEHLESGDNPEERSTREENAPEEEDDGDRDLESGDNPDERRKGL